MECELEVWKLSHQLTLKVYEVSKQFPSYENFGLTSQVRRSAASVPTNIVEGRSRQYKKEFIQFLYVAKGSLEETNYHLSLAKDLKYINNKVYLELAAICKRIKMMLYKLIKSLRDRYSTNDGRKTKIEQNMKIGITFSSFDLLHAGHIKMLEEAKTQCDYLICGLQTDPTLDRPEKNRPIQSVVERYIQLKGCRFVDEIVPYATEQDLEDVLRSFKLDVRIVGDEYEHKDFTGRKFCEEKGIDLYFNKREHRFSSSGLRREVAEKEKSKNNNK